MTMKPPSPSLLRALRAATSQPFRKPPQQLQTSPCKRCLHTTRSLNRSPRSVLTNTPSATRPDAPRIPTRAPKSKDRGPASKEDTQTDFGAMNVLGNTPPPATAIDACLDDGFHLSNGVKITGGDGVLLVGGEAFAWRPWLASTSTSTITTSTGQETKDAMVNIKHQFELHDRAWGLLDLVWPKPELLIIGMGEKLYPLSPETRRRVNELGIRVDILDTRNASAQFNLLATERGVGVVAAAMVPVGWRGL